MNKVSSQQGMKFINQQKILHLIYNESPISRVELAERTALTQQTVTNIVNRLIEDDLVMEGQSTSGARGRRPIPLVIQTSGMFAIGIEVAVKYVAGALIDFSGKVLANERMDVSVFHDAEDTFACIYDVLAKLHQAVPDETKLRGIGLSIQGLVDSKQGIVIESQGLAFDNFPLVARLKQTFDFPIYIENDVNLLAIIENDKGDLAASENNIVLKLDHGIGGAVMHQKNSLSGRLMLQGSSGM
ncbi:ROK family transcriptional regulator [Bacillaceae bacterium SIJ1]|nr:ROK family transcriptional regulator [Litoribacterium kuwaitense]NGP44976.1 ROK family transcriptional regulator [Litoribacterium kuwaitense]